MFDWIQEWVVQAPLFVLFITGFLSATLLPGSSEAAFFTALANPVDPIWLSLIVVSFANALGGMTNFLIGRWLPSFHPKNKRSKKALAWLEKYGYWPLLLSWLPLVGDLLCLVAGWLRLPWLPSTLCVFVGKTVRYAVLIAVFNGVF